MSRGVSPDALAVAREVSSGLMSGGAEAVILVGSHARGGAGPHSDLDLLSVGGGAYDCRLRVSRGFLVSVSEQPLEEFRRDLTNPRRLCTAVPGWREAFVLDDPRGLASSLKEEARLWGWEDVRGECDGWTAEEVTGLAEEVHKLKSALDAGLQANAAVQRSLLAMRLAQVMAVHLRILYGSENRMWDLVSEAMGKEWAETQSAALGLSGDAFEETCSASLKLYGIAAAEALHLMNGRQRAVVERARRLSQSASL